MRGKPPIGKGLPKIAAGPAKRGNHWNSAKNILSPQKTQMTVANAI